MTFRQAEADGPHMKPLGIPQGPAVAVCPSVVGCLACLVPVQL